MFRVILMCVLFVFSIPTLSPAGVIGPARIRLVDGDVMFRTPDASEWLPASVNTPLDEGDAVWCPEGTKAEIQLSDGTLIRMDSDSQLDLLSNEEGFTHLHLANGKLYVRTAQNSAKNSLQIDADDTTVLPEARTRFRIDMLSNSQEDVAIFKGSAYVEGGGNRTKVRAGEHIALEEGHSEILPLNPPDSWESWNVDRDRSQSSSAKADSYLPDELRNHTYELNSYGTWVRVPEYGMVWRPNVNTSGDWAPYRSGRWIWRGNDYVWISYESWGWVPYHYGRWAVASGFGWFWVPPIRGDVYWGPGYVGWYRTGSYIGWTPLAPGELFYGYGHYGRHSVNITNTNVNTSTIAYRNRTFNGGLTVLPHNDFLKGRTTPYQPPVNTSVSVSVSVGSPRIQPQRETRMPIIKQTPPRVAPPKLEYKDNRDLRQRFQRVIPPADPQKRYQQPATATPTTPIANIQTAPVLEKKTVYPAAVPQATPRSSFTQPQRIEPQPRAAGPMPTPQVNAPQLSVPQTVRPQATTPHTSAPQRVEHQPRPEPTVRDQKQKKVWKVTSPEESKEKDSKEKEHKGR
jgi:hypothetical protein